MICPTHKTPSKLIPAGVSKVAKTAADGTVRPAGTPYNSFYACTVQDCRVKQVPEGTTSAVTPAPTPTPAPKPQVATTNEETDWDAIGQQKSRSLLAAAYIRAGHKIINWPMLSELEGWAKTGKLPGQQ